MKIYITDAYLGKFTSDMVEHWKLQGHEVRLQRYWNPPDAEWADIIWIDVADNNIVSATNPSESIMSDSNNYQPWDLHLMDLANKKVIVRAIDIEIWTGCHLGGKWDVVNDLIFIAPHIEEIAHPELLPMVNPDMKIHVIPCGVNLDRYKFSEHKPGFNIAVVSERWVSKGTDMILQIAFKLKKIDPRYKIHWLGQLSPTWPWEHAYMNDFIDRHKLPIEITNVLLDGETVDHWLEDKDYLLHASKKEAYCYAVAEAMAKGIKPVLHRFYGADDIWPGMTWDSIDEAVEMITEDKYDSKSYRQYLIDHHLDLESMMSEFDKIIKEKK